MSEAGFQKDHGETNELVMRRDGRTHTVESVENGYISEKEERTTENNTERCRRDLKSTGLRAGEETDRAMRRRKICSRTDDPT